MPELVALDLPAGQGFVDALCSVWDAGDAVLPVDQRLPELSVRRLLAALLPSRIVSSDGTRSLAGGLPTEPGDALVVATSGTSGAPKGAVHTHRSVTASAVATSERLRVDPGTDRWVACLPLAHIGGLSVVTRSLVTGTPCTVLERFEPSAVEAECRAGATLVSLVTTALGRMDVSGFRAVLLGGAAPPASLPPTVIATYGTTETGSGVVYDGWPLDGVELRIGDGALGIEGEVLVRGPFLLRSYRDGTDPRLFDGWYPTGDAGALAADGSLTVSGRLAEVIVTGGEKVWPAAVEEILAGHPAVSEVAVWKRADPEWGERVVAWVVPPRGVDPPSLGALRELVAATLAPWSAPRQLVVVDRLPRTSGGKVRRTELA